MGGLFGGGKSKSSGSSSETEEPKSTTASSIETADGTIYDRRGSATSAPASPLASAPAPQPMGSASDMGTQPLETILPSARLDQKKRSPAGTLAGQSYGFG